MGRREEARDGTVAVAGVEFQRPSGRGRAWGSQLYGWLYFGGMAAWSLVGSWHGHRVIGLAAALVFLELGLAASRTARLASGVVYTDELARRIAVPLQELCARARCRPPRVVIRDSLVRAAFVRRGRNKKVMLVLSRAFMDQVNDGELRALLAHEVVHVVRDDLSRVRVRVWSAIVGALTGSIVLDLVTLGSLPFPAYAAVFFVLIMPVQGGLSLLNRPLERRADIEGAALGGDPAALAGALRAAHAFSEQARKRLYGPRPWRWLLAPVSWRMPTHPPMAERISSLERMELIRPEP